MLTVASVLPSETTITSYDRPPRARDRVLRRTSRRPAPALWHGSTTESSSVDGADRAYAAWSSGRGSGRQRQTAVAVVLERSHKSADGHDDGRDLLWGLVEEPYQHPPERPLRNQAVRLRPHRDVEKDEDVHESEQAHGDRQ